MLLHFLRSDFIHLISFILAAFRLPLESKMVLFSLNPLSKFVFPWANDSHARKPTAPFMM